MNILLICARAETLTMTRQETRQAQLQQNASAHDVALWRLPGNEALFIFCICNNNPSLPLSCLSSWGRQFFYDSLFVLNLHQSVTLCWRRIAVIVGDLVLFDRVIRGILSVSCLEKEEEVVEVSLSGGKANQSAADECVYVQYTSTLHTHPFTWLNTKTMNTRRDWNNKQPWPWWNGPLACCSWPPCPLQCSYTTSKQHQKTTTTLTLTWEPDQRSTIFPFEPW